VRPSTKALSTKALVRRLLSVDTPGPTCRASKFDTVDRTDSILGLDAQLLTLLPVLYEPSAQVIASMAQSAALCRRVSVRGCERRGRGREQGKSIAGVNP